MKRLSRVLALVLIASSVAVPAAVSDEPPAGLTRDDWSTIRRSVLASQYRVSRVARSSFPHRSSETLVRYAGPTAQGARFPVTVDPAFVHEAELFGHRDGIGHGRALFGSAVSVSADTVVIGAPASPFPMFADGFAYVFVRSGTTWTEQQQLVASDGLIEDFFGWSVSVSGDTVVVGAPLADTAAGLDAGAAYVFVRSGTTWTEQQKLLASDAAEGDNFGWSVSLSGDTVVVGAYADDTIADVDTGSTYVFVRSGTTWTEQQKLLASDGAFIDAFGWSVSVSGDTVVVGARGDDTLGGEDAGSAYVFVRAVTTWTQQQKLLASDGTIGDALGWSVSVSGDTVVVGARADDTPGDPDVGSAYVFVRSGTTWTQQQKLMASDGAEGDEFGWSVSVSGDTMVVGAQRDDTPGGADAGSAYVFVRSGTTWTQQQKLLASDGVIEDSFGGSVSVSGDTVVVGAPYDGAFDAGSAYVFARSGTTWPQQQKLQGGGEDDLAGDVFGWSVAISGDTVVVGAIGDDPGAGAVAGSAYVFVRSGANWTEQKKLIASDGMAGDLFGYSVSISGDSVVVGAFGDDTGADADVGSAYVFVRSGANWTQQQKLVASDGMAGDLFGNSVSISGDSVVVGANFDDTPGGVNAGSAYVFARSGTTWSEQQKLTASNGQAGDEFGASASASGDTVVVGASRDDTPAGADAGSAYVFARSGTTWTQQQQLLASDGAAADHFGASVSVAGNTLVAGAGDDDTPRGVDAGSAYVFVRSGTTWTVQQQLLAFDGAAAAHFGASVSVAGDRLVVGAGDDDALGDEDAGSAYMFVRSGAAWTERQKLVAPDAGPADRFGYSVSVAGDTAVVGAAFDGTPAGGDAGSAHVFREETTVSDIAVAITDIPDPVPLGANLVYAIVVTNNGPDPALGVQVANPTPTGLTFLSNSGACATSFPCFVGAVPAGESRTITATYRVPLGYAGPNPIVDTVTVTAAPDDPSPANNQATAQSALAPASADLAIVKLGPATVAAGSNIVYTITVTNGGPSDAAGVQVIDPTPTGLTFVSNTGSCTTPFPCDLGTVAGGQDRVITATFHVPASYVGPNPIVNLATVTATTPDPNGANDADDASTTVMFVANLEPASIAVDGTGNGVFQPNETVMVAPAWRNSGAGAAASVTGAATSFIGPPGPTYTIADDTATYGTIAPNATVSCAADCYRMANLAATRPTMHWDTTFLERVAPGTATKRWTLHIGDSFTDVPPSSGFYRFIETILHKNVTGGCSATEYCPSASTTRAQMAVFVLVSKEPAGYVPPACVAGSEAFADVPASSPFCRWIEELARRAVVGGCGGGSYCPSSPATREQMAVFVLRTLDPALDPPACGTPLFADVPASSPFCRWIEELVRRGVVTGCGGGNYCPADAVTREQMGVFLTVTFGLALYGP